MTTLLDTEAARPTTAAEAAGTTGDVAAPARRLRATMAACRLQFRWLGTQKALTPEQKARAADAFDADAPFLSAGKRILDTTHPAYRAVTAVRTRVADRWRGLTLPFPEPGTRLIRLDDVAAFDHAMTSHRAELDDAVATLDRRYAELRHAAADRLGSLYNPADYPETLAGLFGVAWDYPNVEPPEYLVRLSPELYRQEQERVAARFEEAVRLAEEAFLAEFGRLVGHLGERLAGTDADGATKVFRDSAVDNLVAFFGRFSSLNVRSSAQLDELVARRRRSSAAWAPRTCATTTACDGTSRRGWPRCRRSWTGWSSRGRGGATPGGDA